MEGIKKKLIQYFNKNSDNEFLLILNKLQSTLIPFERLVIDKMTQKCSIPETYQTKNINRSGIYVFISDNTIDLIGGSLFNCSKIVKLHLDNYFDNDQKCFWEEANCNQKSVLLLTPKDSLDDNLLDSLESFLIKKIKPKNNILLNQYANEKIF